MSELRQIQMLFARMFAVCAPPYRHLVLCRYATVLLTARMYVCSRSVTTTYLVYLRLSQEFDVIKNMSSYEPRASRDFDIKTTYVHLF